MGIISGSCARLLLKHGFEGEGVKGRKEQR